jgi:nucleoside-diphosphate-sugar epimerase
VKTYTGNLCDAVFVEKCLQAAHPEYIFHLAAYKERSVQMEAFKEAITANLEATLNLVTSAQHIPSLQALVVMGTVDEYGSSTAPFLEGTREAPVNAYSFSKLCVTHLCEIMHTLYDLPCVVLRPTVAYGPGQASDMFVPALIQSLIAGKPFPMTKGEQTRDFIYISDLISAILQSGVCRAARGQIINVGSGYPVTIAQLASTVEQLIDAKALVEYGSLPYRTSEIMEYGVNLDKAHNLLNWKAEIALDAGLQETIAYYKRNRRA